MFTANIEKQEIPTNVMNGFWRPKPTQLWSAQHKWGILPQATELAAFWTYCGAGGSVICFIIYAVATDWWERRGRCLEDDITIETENISPQSQELEVTQTETMSKHENVEFVDGMPGYQTTVASEIDQMRDAAFTSDATLDQFFARPIKIQSLEWGQGVSLYSKFDPWSLYFESAKVDARISNYKLMRAKLHIKIVVNGNPFFYGRLISSYNPLRLDDDMTIDRAFIQADLVEATQRPHIFLDPTCSQGGEMELPFFVYNNVIDIPNRDWRNMGELVISSMQNLKHANGATGTFVSVSVFAWATDVKFAIPTAFSPGEILPQADEYTTKPVSRIAGAVANAAGYFTKIPMIGPFARATEIGATAAGAIATLFGYSSPVDLEPSVYRPTTVTNMATTNQKNTSNKLSVDCKQELTLDPRTVGLSGHDEMSIRSIACRESYLTRFSWNVGTLPETLLWNCVVDPCLHQNFSSEIHMPATCFATTPFKYWRGSINMRFQIVCSAYHKGRIKVCYDPTGTRLDGRSDYNEVYTTIIDIGDQTDFEIKCGWGQRNTYREHFIPGVSTVAEMYATTPMVELTPSTRIGNGTLSVYVVNELTVPNSTVNNNIEVNVFVSAGDDFEVATPTSFPMERLRLRNVGIEPQAIEILPQSEEWTPDSKPGGADTLTQMVNSITTSDKTNLVHFGESIHSFRQLLKRYNEHSYIRGPPETLNERTVRCIVSRSAFPYYVGYTETTGVPFFASVVFDIANGPYAYGHTTLLNYLTCAYGGWRGSIRWMAEMSRFSSTAPGGTNLQVSRLPDAPENRDLWFTVFNELSSSVGQAEMVELYKGGYGLDGCVVQNTEINPVVMWELPYYKNTRFVPAKRHSKPDDTDDKDTGWRMEVTCQNDVGAPVKYGSLYCAAGEDFNTFFYLGPPIMYYEPIVPLG